MLDLSEGGLSWRCKVPLAMGDVFELDAPSLRSLIGAEEGDVIRLRIANVKNVGLGFSRVGACFIGLSTNLKQSIRTLVESKKAESESAQA